MKNFLSNISNIFGGDEGNFLGVDIGSSSIKVVQLKKKGGTAVLETYGELSLGPYANLEEGRATNLSLKEKGEALANLIKESNVSAKNCGVAIPSRSSLIFMMNLPNLSESQLSQIVPTEARKYIPVPISEVELDWKLIPPKSSSGSDFSDDYAKNEKTEKLKEVFVVAIHKDTINQQREIISSANLNLKFLEIEIFSTLRSVVGQNEMNFAILDMGAGVTKLYIIDGGTVHDSHIINRGSQDITLNIARSLEISAGEAEELKKKIGVEGETDEEKEVSKIVSSNFEYIFAETNKAILNYQKKHNKNIDKLIVTGGGSIIKGLKPFALTRVETEIKIADPFAKVKTPAFLDEMLKQIGPEFAVALGVAMRGLNELS